MTPSEFLNSTYKELYEYVDSNNKYQKEQYKNQIVLFDALGEKLLGVLASKNPVNKNLMKDSFSKLFEDELKPHQQTIEELVRNLRSRK